MIAFLRRPSLLLAALLFGLVIRHAAAQMTISEEVSPGGLPFLFTHLPESQEQSIQFGWRDGFGLDQPGKQGILSLAPGLILQGPADLTRGEFVEDGKDLQARFSLFASADEVLGGLTAPTGKFNEAAALFARALSMPRLDLAQLQDFQKSVTVAFRQNGRNAAAIASDILTFRLIGPGKLRDYQIGEPALFNAVSIADVKAWRENVLARDGLRIAAAGPQDARTIGLAIDQVFAQLPKASPARIAPAMPALLRQTAPNEANPEIKPKIIVALADVPQTLILTAGWTAYRAPAELTEARLAGRILQMRLFNKVRGALGASYGANAGLRPFAPEHHAFSAQSAVAHDKAPAALAAIEDEISTFFAKGVSAEELMPEIAKAVSETRQSLRQAGFVAGELRTTQLTGRPKYYLAGALTRLEAVTLEGVNAAIRDRMRPATRVVIVVAPKAEGFAADCVIKMASEALSCP